MKGKKILKAIGKSLISPVGVGLAAVDAEFNNPVTDGTVTGHNKRKREDLIKKLPKDIDSNTDKKTRVLVNAIHAKSGGGVTYLKNLLPLLAKDSSLEIHLLLGEKQLDVFTSLDNGVSVCLRKIPNNFFLGLLWEQIMLPFIDQNLSIDVTFSPSNYII